MKHLIESQHLDYCSSVVCARTTRAHIFEKTIKWTHKQNQATSMLTIIYGVSVSTTMPVHVSVDKCAVYLSNVVHNPLSTRLTSPLAIVVTGGLPRGPARSFASRYTVPDIGEVSRCRILRTGSAHLVWYSKHLRSSIFKSAIGRLFKWQGDQGWSSSRSMPLKEREGCQHLLHWTLSIMVLLPGCTKTCWAIAVAL